MIRISAASRTLTNFSKYFRASPIPLTNSSKASSSSSATVSNSAFVLYIVNHAMRAGTSTNAASSAHSSLLGGFHSSATCSHGSKFIAASCLMLATFSPLLVRFDIVGFLPKVLQSTVYVDTLGRTISQRKMLKMTPAQCRAARALLDWTQRKLAKMAALGLSTIVDFERDRRAVSESAAAAIRAPLEAAGVEFIDDGSPSLGGGSGVRLRGGAHG